MFPKSNRPFFFHFYNKDQSQKNPLLCNSSGVTVCLTPTGEGTGVFRVGTATCSNRDNYNRKLGARIAGGRSSASTETIEGSSIQELREKAMMIAETAAAKAR